MVPLFWRGWTLVHAMVHCGNLHDPRSHFTLVPHSQGQELCWPSQFVPCFQSAPDDSSLTFYNKIRLLINILPIKNTDFHFKTTLTWVQMQMAVAAFSITVHSTFFPFILFIQTQCRAHKSPF